MDAPTVVNDVMQMTENLLLSSCVYLITGFAGICSVRVCGRVRQ